MPSVPLTDRSLPKLPVPAGGRVIYFDASTPCFGLRVTANGARSWIIQYRVGRRTRRMTLGTYPKLPLADARDEAKKLLARVALGEDPAVERQDAREAVTFDELAREYLERHAKPRKRSWREDERILRVYVPRAWRTLPAQAITRRQVRDLLEGIADRAPVMANRVRACLSRIYSFAVGRDLVPFNPVRDVERPTVEQARERSFTNAELRAVWRAIEAEDAETAAIFKLALLLGARGGELRGTRWAELDLEAAVWTLPAERAKTKRSRRVPLSAPAVELLRRLRHGGAEEAVFPGRRSTSRATLKDAQRRIAARAGVSGWRTHDLRAACATGLALLGYHSDVIAQVLGHVVPGTTAKHYIRTTREEDVRRALEAWARKLDSIVNDETTAAKVIPLRA